MNWWLSSKAVYLTEMSQDSHWHSFTVPQYLAALETTSKSREWFTSSVGVPLMLQYKKQQ